MRVAIVLSQYHGFITERLEAGARAVLRESGVAEAHIETFPVPGAYESAVGKVMKTLYEERMKLTGQNGLSDYDVGFTNFLYTYAKNPLAKQPREHARI